MRKADPNAAIDDFEDLVNDSLADWGQIDAAIPDQPVALHRKVATDAFLRLAVGWESFFSDWWVGAINRDASIFLAAVEVRLRTEAKTQFRLESSDMPNRLITRSHLSIAQVRGMLDPNERNVVIHGHKELGQRAKAELAGQYQARAVGISFQDWQVVEATRTIRNAITHRSQLAIEVMNGTLRKHSVPVGLRWSGQRNLDIAGIRRYLGTHRPADPDPRIKVFHDRLQTLAAQLRVP